MIWVAQEQEQEHDMRARPRFAPPAQPREPPPREMQGNAWMLPGAHAAVVSSHDAGGWSGAAPGPAGCEYSWMGDQDDTGLGGGKGGQLRAQQQNNWRN